MKGKLTILVAAALCLSGCVAPPVPTTNPSIQPTVPTVATETIAPSAPTVAIKQEPMYAISVPVITESDYAEDGTVIFTGIYQNISLTVPDPEVADKVIVDFLNRTDISALAQEIRNDAKEAYAQSKNAPLPYLCGITYEPMRIDSGVLSLLGNSSAFRGGMHAESITKAVSYDLLTGNQLSTSAILNENTTAEDIIPLINEALQPQSSALYEGYEEMIAEKFSHGMDQNPDWYFSDEGLCFFFSPYEIGPFASGTIVAQIPYSRLAGIVRDAYFPAEQDLTAGKVDVIAYDQADLDAYTQFAEVTTDSNAKKVLLATTGSVQNLRISRDLPAYAGSGHTMRYVVFAAAGLTPGDAIVIQSQDSLQLSYSSGTEQITDTVSPE